MDKPDVDVIEGLSPAISIEQKATSHNPRSTVGTVTEIHDYLRLLFARAGTPYCPNHALRAAGAERQPDGRRDAGAAGRDPADGAGAGRARPQGRVRRAVRADAGAGLRALSRRRRDRRSRRRAEAEEGREARHRRRHRPRQGARRGDVASAAPLRQRLAESFEAALRIADGRALAVEMDEAARRAPLLEQVRLPALQLLAARARAAPVLVQLAGRRLPDLRRPRRDDGVRRRARRRLPVAEPGQRRGQGLGPAQRLHLLAARERRRPLRLRHRHAVRGAAGRARARCCCTARATDEIEFVYEAEGARGKQRSVKRKHPFEGILPNLERRFRETDSAAVREDLARLRAPSPAPTATARGCGVEARNVFLVDVAQRRASEPIFRVEHFTLREALAWFERLALAGAKAEIADKVIREIRSRLKFLNDVGLNYLSLDRSAETLSGGEAQRIRLASQIGSGLTGVMYVLDEPSIGLHQRDNERLIGTLFHLRDIGNSVHRRRARRGRDPRRRPRHRHGPGRRRPWRPGDGAGPPEDVAAAPESLTGRYLSHALRIAVPKRAPRRRAEATWLRIAGARGNNLQQRRRRHSGRPLHLRHRRLRLGQVDARQRHALRRRRQAPLQQPRRARAARRASPASTPSTR